MPTVGDAVRGELSGVYGYGYDIGKTLGGLLRSSGPDVQPTAELGPASIAYEKEGAAKKKEQAAAAKAKQTQAIQQNEIKQVEASPWTQMGNALAQQYQEAAQAAQQYMNPTGSNASSTQAATATNNALSSLGLGAGSPAAGWLGQQQAAAGGEVAALDKAEAQQAGAYAAQAGPITQALMQFGQANALGIMTAPESPWLTGLASHITSNLSYYGEVPKADEATFAQNPALGSALISSGGYGGAGGTGLVPVTSLPQAGGAKPASSQTPSLPGLPSGANVPTAGSTPSS